MYAYNVMPMWLHIVILHLNSVLMFVDHSEGDSVSESFFLLVFLQAYEASDVC